MTPEGKVAEYLIRCVKANGWMQRKVEWSGRIGAPDRFVMIPNGRSFWVELKKDDRTAPKPHQLREITRMREAGNVVYVAGSAKRIDEIIENEKRVYATTLSKDSD